MVTNKSLEFNGRLGNTMFKIASTIGIARSNAMFCGFATWSWQHGFKNEIPSLPYGELAYNKYNEPAFNYSNVILDPQFNWDLEGYFQSEKYFINCKEEILSYFEFTDELNKRMVDKYFTVLKSNPVSIHVRRGDYLTIPTILPVLPLEYYNKAVSQFDKNQHFLIFSDDIEFVKKHFIASKFTIIEGNTDIEDMCLMSLCKHNVIANSSYSWWGSYLNLNPKKKVLAPAKNLWFGPGVNNIVDDLYCDNWHII